jgi:small-conductance mechanosensitive channel
LSLFLRRPTTSKSQQIVCSNGKQRRFNASDLLEAERVIVSALIWVNSRLQRDLRPSICRVNYSSLYAILICAAFVFVLNIVCACAQSASTVSTTVSSTAPLTGLIEFDKKILFSVAASPKQDASDSAQDINNALTEAWDKYKRGKAGFPQAVNKDGSTEIKLNGELLADVTETDSANASLPDDELATVWADKINAAFRQKQLEDQPYYLRIAIEQSVIAIAIAIVLLSTIRFIGRRYKLGRFWTFYFLVGLLAVIHVINLFGASRTVFFNLATGSLRPLFIAVYVAAPAAAVARTWSIFMRAIFPPLPEHISSQELIRRTNLRRRSLAGAAEVSGATFIWMVAAVIGMSWYGFNPSSLLTSAGLIGVAIGLVAQDTIRDHLAGIYILLDDRYGMGDVIRVGEFEGRVERLNLRMTQIRDMSGRLITMSNRNTTEVANLTARWAQVDFRVGISYYTNIDQALAVLEKVGKQLASDLADNVLNEPEIIGVEAFNDTNISLRMVVRTPPGDQSLIGHELRKRVKLAFDSEKIAMFNDQKIEPGPTLPS